MAQWQAGLSGGTQLDCWSEAVGQLGPPVRRLRASPSPVVLPAHAVCCWPVCWCRSVVGAAVNLPTPRQAVQEADVLQAHAWLSCSPAVLPLSPSVPQQAHGGGRQAGAHPAARGGAGVRPLADGAARSGRGAGAGGQVCAVRGRYDPVLAWLRGWAQGPLRLGIDFAQLAGWLARAL